MENNENCYYNLTHPQKKDMVDFSKYDKPKIEQEKLLIKLKSRLIITKTAIYIER